MGILPHPCLPGPGSGNNYTDTTQYTYDDAGNILSKAEYAYTTGTLGTAVSTVSYTYGDTSWGDLLTGYGGKTVTIDTVGNMLSDGTWTYTWEHGRELASMTGSGTTWSFTYDADGMRTRRTNGSTDYSYVYNGGSLSRMTVGSTTLDFRYDASGTPMTVTYGGTTYYYATNLQGDVVAILDGSGTAVVAYTYDAWGNVLSTTGSLASTLGTHNPLRYRGYVYDTETELYYLQSRYYDPSLGRFINADSYVSTGQGILGNNMFAYCLNNPIAYEDSTGNFAGTLSPNTKLNEVKTYFEGGIGGVIAIGVTITISDTFEDIAEDIKAWVEAATSTSERRDQHVYVLTDPANNYMVKYVGRTNDPSRRLYEHQHDAMHPERQTYVMTVLVAGLTKNQAKLLEQVLISAYTLDHLDNARREIAAGNIMKYYSYLGAVAEIIGGATESSLRDLIG